MNKLPRKNRSARKQLAGCGFILGVFALFFLSVFYLPFPFGALSVAAYIAVFGFIAFQLNKKNIAARELAMRQISAQTGFTYHQNPPAQMNQHLQWIKSNFADNRFDSNALKNVMTGKLSNQHVAVFDHTFTVEAGSSRVTERETVFVVISDKLKLPQFKLEEGRGGFLGQAVKNLFGTRDIRFVDRPDFTKKYQLHGDDETVLRRIFTPQIMKFYEDEYPLQTLAGGNMLCIFEPRESEEPPTQNEIQDWLNGLMKLHDLFAQNQTRRKTL